MLARMRLWMPRTMTGLVASGCLLAALALAAAAARWVPPPSLYRRAGDAGERPRVLS